jgi:hypothetical protein
MFISISAKYLSRVILISAIFFEMLEDSFLTVLSGALMLFIKHLIGKENELLLNLILFLRNEIIWLVDSLDHK